MSDVIRPSAPRWREYTGVVKKSGTLNEGGAATTASARPGPFRTFCQGLLAKGMLPAMARLTLARKMAAITLSVWKKGESFDAEQLKPQAD